MFEVNRIIKAIARKKAEIDQRIKSGLVTAEKVEEVRKKLDMEYDEYVRFQELKTLAVADGKLTLDEGMTVYAYLGETLNTFNKQPVEVKAVLTRLFGELLRARIGMMQSA